MKIIGIDLAGKSDNPTGICVLTVEKTTRGSIRLCTLYSNEEILEKINSLNPSLIVVDAPLSLPKGRCCLEKDCECATGGHFRQGEREIRRYGSVLPLTFTGMKMLTMRGVSLANALSGQYMLNETHPRTVQKILGFEDPKKDLEHYFTISPEQSIHELDAALAALCGFFYINNCYMELGDVAEGTIILPMDKECLNRLNSLSGG